VEQNRTTALRATAKSRRALCRALATQKEDMNNSPLKFWKAFPSLIAGVVLGIFFIIFLRVFYYDIMNLQPEMHPGIAFLFSPILLIAVLCLALPSELLLRLLYAPTSHFNAGLIGISYTSVLSFWAFPLHWWIVFGFNPIILRIIFSLTHRWCGTARTMPPHSF
jgi:hypothetical protein